MKKKDYQSLQSKYSSLVELQERHRQELIDFIHEAFEKHGNEFEYKCDTHATWQEKNEDEEDDFDAMDDLPTCVTIWVDDDGGHEVYPTVVRQCVSDTGYKSIEVDGWDWYSCEWVECQDVNNTIGELESVAEFINAVLEQEQEMQILQMGERIDWEGLMEDIRTSVKNEKLWAMGASSEEERLTHCRNVEDLENELKLVEQKDFQSLLELRGEDFFKDFLL